MQALCRGPKGGVGLGLGRGGGGGGRRKSGQQKSPPHSDSSSSTSFSYAASAAAGPAADKAFDPREAVILLTRLGGARLSGTNDTSSVTSPIAEDFSGEEKENGSWKTERVAAPVTATAMATSTVTSDMTAAGSSLSVANENSGVSALLGATRSEATAQRLRRLWRAEREGDEDEGPLPQAAQTEQEKGSSRGSGGNGDVRHGRDRRAGRGAGGRTILLHVVAGPGAFLAVREAIAAGEASVLPLSCSCSDSGSSHLASSLSYSAANNVGSTCSSSPGEAGADDDVVVAPISKLKEKVEQGVDGSVAESCCDVASVPVLLEGRKAENERGGDETGMGCRVLGRGGGGSGGRVGGRDDPDGVTVAALGSLRRDGAYCVMKLGLPQREGGVKRGWSVAGVEFGRIAMPLTDDAERR